MDLKNLSALVTDGKYAEDFLKILKAGGYSNGWANHVHGKTIDSREMFVFRAVFSSTMLLTVASVLGFSFGIRRQLRVAVLSFQADRLNAQINRVLLALVVTPLLTDVLPNVYVNYAVVRCQSFFLGDLLNSFLLAAAPSSTRSPSF
ncbi:hypothetical protein M3Y99_01306800 [Aphelenchoides fujianensis]|nr:hypothetical protein M3Y99_01306800 [Aphelenchoides fujianensis]